MHDNAQFEPCALQEWIDTGDKTAVGTENNTDSIHFPTLSPPKCLTGHSRALSTQLNSTLNASNMVSAHVTAFGNKFGCIV